MSYKAEGAEMRGVISDVVGDKIALNGVERRISLRKLFLCTYCANR